MRELDVGLVNGDEESAEVVEGSSIPVRMGEGLRLTYSCIASSAHVSRDLKEYLFDTLAISMRSVRFAFGEVIILNSGGLYVFKCARD